MKKLKDNQLGPWCSFCPPKTTRATFRSRGRDTKHCCDEHKPLLAAYEKEQRVYDDYYTEADYQTWMRL